MPNHFFGRVRADVLSPRDQPRYREAIEEAVQGGVSEIEYELIGLSGSRRWMYQRARRIEKKTADDRAIIVCVTREVTQRKLAKDRLDHAIDVTNQGLWDEWIQSGDIYYNDNWFSMLGYDPGELPKAKQTWHDLLHPEDFARASQDFKRHMTGETALYQCEYRLRTKDNNWKWILDVGRIVERSENGTALCAIGVHIDIDRPKRLELALRSIVSFNQNSSEDSVLLHICRTLTETLDIERRLCL